jgi:hypothetical protein
MYKLNNKILENLHLPLWILKDIAWSNEMHTLGITMAIPTNILAIYIAIKTRKSAEDFLPNLAVVCWIAANTIWMIDEFFLLEIMIWSKVGFVIGLILMAIWCVLKLPKLLRKVES